MDVAGNRSVGMLNLVKGTAASELFVQFDDPSPRVVNQNVTLAGSVSGTGNIDALLIQVDLGNVVSIDTTGDFAFTTDFPLDGSADGQHLIRFRALDEQGNVSPVVSGSRHARYRAAKRDKPD